MNWADHDFVLFHERALFLPGLRALVVADTHFGKPAAFRVSGVPVPFGTTEADLARLDALLDRTKAARLIVLGDFFHAKTGRDADTMAVLRDWFAGRAGLATTLVRGNHDLRAGDPPGEWGVECVSVLREGSLIFRHHPEPPEGDATGYVLAGHLHPAVSLAARGDALRAPCFWFAGRVATLPAFGSFTGAKSVRPRPGDRVFAVGPDAVAEVSRRKKRA